ncbi:MAG: protein kinase [Deltaproteobacteria bacterium]|nr:protein kinase [Deltaproteobacteria bacterium]
MSIRERTRIGRGVDAPAEGLSAILRAHARLVWVAREQLERASDALSAPKVSASRALRELVEASRGHPSGLAKVALLGPAAEVAGRAAASADLAVAMGQSLGLRSRDLVDLGTAVLLHSVLGSDSDRAFVVLFAAEPTTASGRLRARIAGEIMTKDSPTLSQGARGHPFARIGTVATCFVRAFSDQPEGDADPLRALEVLASEPEGTFDARIFDLLVNTLRAFPEGTAVMLESGTPGVVARHLGDRPQDRPLVTVGDPGREVDLLREGRTIVATAAYAGLVGPRTTVDRVADLDRKLASRTRVLEPDGKDARGMPAAAVATARVRTPAPPKETRRASAPPIAVADTAPPEVPRRPTIPDRPPTASAQQPTTRERSIASRGPFPETDHRGRLLDAFEHETTEEAELPREVPLVPPARPSEIARFLFTTAGSTTSALEAAARLGPWSPLTPPPEPTNPATRPSARSFDPASGELGVAELFPELFRSVRSVEAEARTETHRPLWPAGTRPPSTDPRGRALFGYQVQGEPKKVGVAIEYDAIDAYDSTRVQLRVLDSGHIDESKLPAAEWVRLLELEAAVASVLSHPSVPRLVDSGVSEPLRFVAYERPEGEQLREVIARRGRDRRLVRRLVRGLADALFHMHQRGVLHCNVRAANVLVRDTGEGTLSDLSLAIPAGQPLHPLLANHTISLPPEFHTKGEFGPAADQFALGALLFELLTGAHPYQVPGGERLKTGAAFAPDPREIAKDADALLSAIALRMLRPEPSERFESCDAVARHLSRAGAIARKIVTST